MINEKSRILSGGTYNNRWGSKKTNPEITNNKANSPKNIDIANPRYFLDPKTSLNVCLYKPFLVRLDHF